MLSLLVLEQIWRYLALSMMVSTVWSLLFVTLLVYLGVWLVILLLLLLQLLNLLISRKHALDIIAWHRTWTWISVAIKIPLNSICKLRTIIVVRRGKFRSDLLPAVGVVRMRVHTCMIAVDVRVYLIAWFNHTEVILVCSWKKRILHFFESLAGCTLTKIWRCGNRILVHVLICAYSPKIGCH